MAEGPLSKAPNPSLLPGRQLADSPLLFVLIQNWAKNWPLQLTSEFLRSEDASCPGELRPNRAGKQLVALISLKYSCLSLRSTDQERWSHLASPLPLLVLLSASVCLSSLFTAEASGNFLIFVLFKSFTWFPPHARLISYSPCLKALPTWSRIPTCWNHIQYLHLTWKKGSVCCLLHLSVFVLVYAAWKKNPESQLCTLSNVFQAWTWPP